MRTEHEALRSDVSQAIQGVSATVQAQHEGHTNETEALRSEHTVRAGTADMPCTCTSAITRRLALSPTLTITLPPTRTLALTLALALALTLFVGTPHHDDRAGRSSQSHS